jgi:hypothetical protein
MKTSIGFGVVALALAAAGATAGTFNDQASYLAATQNHTVINFDTDPTGQAIAGGTFLDSIYASQGVIFGPGGIAAGGVGPVSAPNIWVDDTNVSSTGPLFTAFITAPNITAVGVFNALFSGGGLTTLTAFDAGNNVLESVNADTDVNSLDFFGVTTNAPIARIEIQFVNQFGWGVDDLHFGQVIPAPGFAAFGLAGVLAAARRRR